MDTFPDTIRIKILDEATGQPVPNVAVFIKLFATVKNDFVFMPDYSNDRGEIIITRQWLSDRIRETADFFVMDYASTLGSCYPRFEIRVLSAEELGRAIKARHLYQTALNTKSEDIERLSQVDNLLYQPTSRLVHVRGEAAADVVVRISRAWTK